MELAYAFLARAAQFSEGGLGIFGADIQSLEGALPLRADALVLVAKVEFLPEECGRAYVFVVRVTSPEGETSDGGEPLEFTPPGPGELDKLAAILLVDLAETVFSVEGPYTITLLVDGRPLKALKLAIFADQGVVEGAATA